MSTCNEQAHVHTKIASSGKISEILGISNAPFPSPLCTHRYYLVYDTRGGYRGGGAMGALAPPFPKVGGSTVCARAASRNYNWTIYSK